MAFHTLRRRHLACITAFVALPLWLTACGGGGATPTLKLTASDIKTLQIEWPQAAGGSRYRLLFAPGGSASAQLVATLPASVHRHTLSAFLPALANGRYTLQICNEFEGVSQCADGPSAVMDAAVLNAAIGYFKASNASFGFGSAVALSQDGTTLAVGASGDESAATGINGDQSDTSAPGSGAVYVFQRGASGWVQLAYVKASNTGSGDGFGRAVALSADGNTLAVGARDEDSSASGIDGNQADNATGASGAVYVFTRSGGQWSQQAYVKASNPALFAEFGGSVALAGDGNTLAVGAQSEASNATGIDGNQADQSAGDAGAVYVYARSGSTWAQRAYVKASNTDPDGGDQFGHAVALSYDGNTLVVGAPREDSTATGVDGDQADNTGIYAGAVYVFTRGGGAWSQLSYLKASNTAVGDNFGSSVALSADGQTIAVGAVFEDKIASGINDDQGNAAPTVRDTGAVYVFTRASGTWSQQAYVKATNTGDLDNFGQALALSANGDTLAVSAPREDGASPGFVGNGADNASGSSGAAYVYRRTGANWSPLRYLKASNPDSGDGFGESIAISGDGLTLAVGGTNEDSAATGIGGDQNDNSADGRGAVYLY